MKFAFWLILFLLFLSWWQYTYQQKSHDVLSKGYEPLNNFIHKKTPLKPVTSNSTVCPTTKDYVCGVDKITYDNICFAALAGIGQVTQGVCS